MWFAEIKKLMSLQQPSKCTWAHFILAGHHTTNPHCWRIEGQGLRLENSRSNLIPIPGPGTWSTVRGITATTNSWGAQVAWPGHIASFACVCPFSLSIRKKVEIQFRHGSGSTDVQNHSTHSQYSRLWNRVHASSVFWHTAGLASQKPLSASGILFIVFNPDWLQRRNGFTEALVHWPSTVQAVHSNKLPCNWLLCRAALFLLSELRSFWTFQPNLDWGLSLATPPLPFDRGYVKLGASEKRLGCKGYLGSLAFYPSVQSCGHLSYSWDSH